MATVYFLGAGASAADGLPITRELNYCVAAYLRTAKGGRGPLAKYYEEVYAVSPSDLTRCAYQWQRFLSNRDKKPEADNPLPSLMETLSILDLMLAEQSSIGVSKRRRSRRSYEANPAALASVRGELSMAIALGIQQAVAYHRTPCAKALISRLASSDCIVTTNWDTLIDRALTSVVRAQLQQKWLTVTNITYGGVGERLVNWRGRDITKRTDVVFKLLKLHGSLNWFHCPCCGNLYANVEGTWVINPQNRRPDHDECHCGAGLENVVVVPSLVREYRNTHLRSVWQLALNALKNSHRWIFVGYSLPKEDYHIRALLLRGFRARNALTRSNRIHAVDITVVTDQKDLELETRFKDLFRTVKIVFHHRGFRKFLHAG